MTATLAPTPVAPVGVHEDERLGLRELCTDSLVYARRNIQHIRQIPEKLLDVTIQPLMFVMLFAFVFGGAIEVDGGGYREYLIGGILIQSLSFAMMGPATAIATDLGEGVIDRFRSLPSSRGAYLLGHYLAEMAGIALSIVVLLAAGLMVGWRTHTDFLHVAEAILLLVVFASAVIWFGTWLGMIVRSPDAVMGVGFTAVFPLTFLSNAFVPIATLPNVLQWIASVNPVSVMVAAVRTLFGNPLSPIAKDIWPMQHPVIAAWAYCLMLLGIAVPLSLHRYKMRTLD
ncbi:MAG TPA: ABC transporter permease [Ilumatobacteraceae bacterium]|nr:ABC transporter permease [Ilumatobacteraceae bacterium]HRB02489.1 ABC transporter permease [Ilumatobacteraceae bacterium]